MPTYFCKTCDRCAALVPLSAQLVRKRYVLPRVTAGCYCIPQGVAQKLGISYEDLKTVNPDIIYVSISGFGGSGPLSAEPVYDPLVQARSGFVDLQSRLHEDPVKDTRLINSLIHDKTTAMTAVQAIMAALFAARVNGAGGQHVEIAMLDVGLQFLWGDAHSQLADNYWVEKDTDDRIRINPSIIQESFAVHPCKDGHVAFLQMERDLKFERFAKYFAPHFLTDERFNSPRGRMVINNAEFRAAIDDALKDLTKNDIIKVLNEQDIPGAPVYPLNDSWRQPQVIHNGTVIERYNEKVETQVREVRLAPQFSATPLALSDPAPLYGEHTAEILNSLGYSKEDITAMAEAGVVRTGFDSS